MSSYSTIIRDSFAEAKQPSRSSLLSECAEKGSVGSTTSHVISGSASSSSLTSSCGPTCELTVPEGATLTMDADLNVASLQVDGSLLWTDGTQAGQVQKLCAGYVAGTGRIEVDVEEKEAFIYVKNNGLSHPILGTRSLGAYQADAGAERAVFDVRGKVMPRTWSLLAAPAKAGDAVLTLMHDAGAMGWKAGDRVLVAPTQRSGSQGDGEASVLVGVDGNVVTLDKQTGQDFQAAFEVQNGLVATMSAEVINLSRNLVITGDEFENVPCDDSLSDDFGEGISGQGCLCTSERTQCTVGLHTVGWRNSVFKLQGARVERCGQRGIAGKYCAHMHLLGSSPESIIRGNAFEHSMQRGVVIHGTHRSTVDHNVFSDVRGAALYIEDGNELLNNLEYNVGICPWRLGDPEKWGCTIPGTSNGEADTSLNQAGVWALSPSNSMLGNR